MGRGTHTELKILDNKKITRRSAEKKCAIKRQMEKMFRGQEDEEKRGRDEEKVREKQI